MITVERIIVVVGAVVAVLLQVLIASHVAIGYGMPNIIAVYCLAVAVVQPGVFKYVLPFVLGLAYDFVSGGPIGAMAFSLTAAAALVTWFYRHSNNDTLFMGFVAMALGVLFVELSYGVFFLMFGYTANLLDALALRILPNYLYNLVLGLIAYPIADKFLANKAPLRSEITQLH